jgi:hypothetical protein
MSGVMLAAGQLGAMGEYPPERIAKAGLVRTDLGPIEAGSSTGSSGRRSTSRSGQRSASGSPRSSRRGARATARAVS